MKNLNLIVIIFFLSISAKCQVIGFEGQYGVDNYLDGVIEGIVEKENSGKLYINRDFGQGPTILTYPETIYIGGYYNKSIIYNKSNPSLEITFYKDNSQKIIIKRIEYSSDNKRTYPYVNGKYPSDYRSILNEDFNGNLENIINNEINIVRNSLNGYDPNYLVQFNSRKNQNNNNDKKLLTGKIKKWQNKKVFSGNDCDDLFDDDVLAEKNNMLKEAILLITIRLNKCKTTEKFFVIKKRAELYYANSEYKKALSDFLICEGLLKGQDKMVKTLLYDQLKDCYYALGDYKSSKIYESKSNGNFIEIKGISNKTKIVDDKKASKKSKKIAPPAGYSSWSSSQLREWYNTDEGTRYLQQSGGILESVAKEMTKKSDGKCDWCGEKIKGRGFNYEVRDNFFVISDIYLDLPGFNIFCSKKHAFNFYKKEKK